MSNLDQSSVDDILAQVEAQAAEVSKETGSEPAAGTAVDMPAQGEVGADFDPLAVAGEFDAPSADFAPVRHSNDVKRLLSLEVPLIVQLGQKRMNVAEVMRLGVGAIIEFAKSADDEMDLLVNNKQIGRGHTVKVGENFGIKISTIGPVKETIKKLGGLA